MAVYMESLAELTKDDTIIVFGYTDFSRNFIYRELIEDINCNVHFCDNSPEKHGIHENVQVFYPWEAVKLFPDACYILASFESGNLMACQLLDLGITEENIYRYLEFKKSRYSNLVFSVDLVAHCNLKCKYCDHFSPLAKENYVSREIFERDFKRISDLFDGKVSEIKLIGGEPLLNKDINDYILIARSFFPQAKIYIITNGILLPDMPTAFWNICSENDITIKITHYPVELNYKQIFDLADKSNVAIILDDKVKFMRHTPFDLEGKQEIVSNFVKCTHGNNCVALKEGKFYTCTIIPCVEIFNTYFNKRLEICEEDSIDIYKAANAKEILEFLRNPVPFCRHCYISRRSAEHKWSISEKKIEEWTVR